MDHVNNNTNTWMMIMSPTTPTLMPPTRQTAIVVTTGINQGPSSRQCNCAGGSTNLDLNTSAHPFDTLVTGLQTAT